MDGRRVAWRRTARQTGRRPSTQRQHSERIEKEEHQGELRHFQLFHIHTFLRESTNSNMIKRRFAQQALVVNGAHSSQFGILLGVRDAGLAGVFAGDEGSAGASVGAR